VVTEIVACLIDLPCRAVVLADDETYLNLLPHVRASWTLHDVRPQVLTPGTNWKVTVLGAIEVSTRAWVYWLGRRCAADFIALLDQVLQAFPHASVIAMICDNDSIHHARKVTAYLDKHPRLELLYGPPSARTTTRPNGSGGTEEQLGEHRRELARPPTADPRLLPRPLTRSDAGHRRALDQPTAAARLRAKFWNGA
jgi:hypothetical protein